MGICDGTVATPGHPAPVAAVAIAAPAAYHESRSRIIPSALTDVFGARQYLALENLVLRHQLEVF